MRYTFKQLLEAQNKKNSECNDEIVKSVIDGLFIELERYVITDVPTTKCFYCNMIFTKDDFIPMSQLTMLERKKILEAFTEQGFRSVSFKTILDDECPDEIGNVYFVCEWE